MPGGILVRQLYEVRFKGIHKEVISSHHRNCSEQIGAAYLVEIKVIRASNHNEVLGELDLSGVSELLEAKVLDGYTLEILEVNKVIVAEYNHGINETAIGFEKGVNVESESLSDGEFDFLL